MAVVERLHCSYFKINALAKEEKSFEVFLFLALAAILFNGAEQFEQFLESYPRNLPVKLSQNLSTDLAEEVT